ncbi:hypothetical protein TFLX_06489 [Thermoflexales bacterium]|nr:hypothetical protein TFLX_06489 [Thermoflexales bacterium]
MSHLALSFLGIFQVTRDGQPVRDFRVNAARALLVYLALESDRPHRRESLAGLLWPDLPDGVALRNLRHTLTDLRHALGEPEAVSALHVTRRTLQFNLDRSTWLDVAAFQRGIRAADLSEIEQAVALYHGPLLAGLALTNSPLFEEWLLVRQQHLAQLAVAAQQRLAEWYAASGDYRRARDYAAQMLEIDPWHEVAQHLLMQALALDGQRGAALAQYEAYRDQLARELNAQPSGELTAAYERLRLGQRAISPLRASLGATPPTSDVVAPTEFATPTQCVARDQELARLQQLLSRARRGYTLSNAPLERWGCPGGGHLVFISGEAGSGKTVLLAEFTRRALLLNSDVIIAGGACSAQTGQGDPYLPFREILKLLTGDIEAHRASGALAPAYARRLWDAVPEALAALIEHGPDLIGPLLDGHTLALRAEAFTPLPARWRTRLTELTQRPSPARPLADLHHQIATVLAAIAHTRPLILIIDDAQWADAETIGLLFHLSRFSSARWLILCAYRSGDVIADRAGQRHPLSSVINEVQRLTGQLPINLDEIEGRAFIDALLDAEPNELSVEFREALYQHTNGHALFTVEMISGLKSRGQLVRNERGAWVAGEQLEWQHLPARVEAVIAEHVERVPARWQALLQAACVAGGEFIAGVVAGASGLAEDEVVRALSGELSQRYQLVTATRVERSGAQRWLRYRFRHTLFETYLYQRLDAVTRTRLHETIGTGLEQCYADRPDAIAESALQLAWHFEAAGLNLKAAGYELIAGQRAQQLSAYHEASQLFMHGLTLLAAVPDSRERAQLEMNLQLTLAAVLLEQGWGTPDQARVFDRALELAQQSEATIELAYALHLAVDLAQGRGESAKAVTVSQDLLRLAEQIGRPPLLALAHYSLGSSLLLSGDLGSARAQLAQAVLLNDQSSQQTNAPLTGADVGLGALSWSILAAWLTGDHAAAEAHIEQVMARAHQIDHAFSLGIALMVGVCPYWLWQGRSTEDQGRHYIDQLSRLAEGDVPMFRAWVKVFDGYWRARRGEVTGLAELRQGMAEWAVTGSRSGYAYQRLLLIEAYLIAGEIAAAQQAADEACAFIEQSGNQVYEAELYRLSGEIAAARGDNAEAEACFRAAIEVAQAQGAITWAQRAMHSLERGSQSVI